MKRKPPKHKLPPKRQLAAPIPEPDDVVVVPDPKPARLINRAEVLRRIPVSYGTLWSWMTTGKFPKSKNLGLKPYWLEDEVEAWIRARPDNRFKNNEPKVSR